MKKPCFLFFARYKHVTGDKQVLWLLSSHLVVLHSTNYDSPAGAVAYMGLLGLLAILVSTLYILFPLELLAISGFPKMPSLKNTKRNTGKAMHDNKGSKVTQEVPEQRTTRRSVSYPVQSKVMGSPGAETKSHATKFSNYEII